MIKISFDRPIYGSNAPMFLSKFVVKELEKAAEFFNVSPEIIYSVLISSNSLNSSYPKEELCVIPFEFANEISKKIGSEQFNFLDDWRVKNSIICDCCGKPSTYGPFAKMFWFSYRDNLRTNIRSTQRTSNCMSFAQSLGNLTYHFPKYIKNVDNSITFLDVRSKDYHNLPFGLGTYIVGEVDITKFNDYKTRLIPLSLISPTENPINVSFNYQSTDRVCLEVVTRPSWSGQSGRVAQIKYRADHCLFCLTRYLISSAGSNEGIRAYVDNPIDIVLIFLDYLLLHYLYTDVIIKLSTYESNKPLLSQVMEIMSKQIYYLIFSELKTQIGLRIDDESIKSRILSLPDYGMCRVLENGATQSLMKEVLRQYEF